MSPSAISIIYAFLISVPLNLAAARRAVNREEEHVPCRRRAGGIRHLPFEVFRPDECRCRLPAQSGTMQRTDRRQKFSGVASMVSRKQRTAARRNIKKAAAAAKRKRT